MYVCSVHARVQKAKPVHIGRPPTARSCAADGTAVTCTEVDDRVHTALVRHACPTDLRMTLATAQVFSTDAVRLSCCLPLLMRWFPMLASDAQLVVTGGLFRRGVHT
jgi:hypothetical protein